MCLSGLLLLAAMLLGGCALPFQIETSDAPMTYPTEYQWQDGPKVAAFSFPTTPDLPGTTVSVAATHRIGMGPTLHASSPLDEALRQGTQVLAQTVTQMKASGWSPLFLAVQTGAYPTLAQYVTLKRGAHYCFIEYSAVEVSVGQASQRLDIYYS